MPLSGTFSHTPLGIVASQYTPDIYQEFLRNYPYFIRLVAVSNSHHVQSPARHTSFIPHLKADSARKIQKVIGYFQKVIGRGEQIWLTFTAYRGPTGAAGGADDCHAHILQPAAGCPQG
jgi:hypothetical protein